MKKFFAKHIGNNFIFDGDEFAHFNVLRCKIGEQVICFGDDGYDYLCEIKEITKKQAIASIINKEINTKNPKINLTVFQGLVKGEKLDLIVQKLTEIGISNLYTFESEYAIAKANNNKIDRLRKISMESCKQCGRNIPLNIYENLKFNEMVDKLKNFDLILFANEKNKVRNFDIFKKCKNIAIIVGSEGGFSDNEINLIYSSGAINFGLGERILRAETAVISISAIISYILDV